MSRTEQHKHLTVVLLIGVAVLFGYFFSEAVLRQFVLHRAGIRSISLNSLIGKLPPVIRDEVIRRVSIAELEDELRTATTTGKKITISITLAGLLSPQKLQEKYAEVIDKYPTAPEAQPAFVNFLLAPPGALKSISVARYHKFIGLLDKQQRFWAWSAGLGKLQNLKVSSRIQMEYLLPLLDCKPDCREYQSLYMTLSELAFQEKKREIELKANKLQVTCETLPFFDAQLEKQARTKAGKLARAKAKAAKVRKQAEAAQAAKAEAERK
ncbi:MAG: hypothetical protein PHV59_02200 [Victivallales bacterium]|nr:hypothetical protein [Victivallales bacterium]